MISKFKTDVEPIKFIKEDMLILKDLIDKNFLTIIDKLTILGCITDIKYYHHLLKSKEISDKVGLFLKETTNILYNSTKKEV